MQENGEPPDFAAVEKLLGVKLPVSAPAGGDNCGRIETSVDHHHQAHGNEQPITASQTTGGTEIKLSFLSHLYTCAISGQAGILSVE